MYAKASRFTNHQVKSNRLGMIQHFFYNPLVEEHWKTKVNDVSREDFSKMEQDKMWSFMLKYPYDEDALDTIPFGKYQGITFKEVYQSDSDYLVWVLWTKRNNDKFMKLLCSNVDIGFLMKRLFALR